MTELDDIATLHWRDYRTGDPGSSFAELGGHFDLARAYELQDAVCRLRVRDGDRVIGYKVGCTGPGVVELFGMSGPIRGTIYQSEACRSGAVLRGRAFANLAVEGEMAVFIGDDGAASAAVPVIELHNFVFRWPRKTLVELVANNGLNAGVVLPLQDWRSSTWHLTTKAVLSVAINGAVVGEGDLWPSADGPAASVDWLRDHLRRCGLALAPGDVVLAGTPLGLYPVSAGDHVVAGLDGAPSVECHIS